MGRVRTAILVSALVQAVTATAGEPARTAGREAAAAGDAIELELERWRHQPREPFAVTDAAETLRQADHAPPELERLSRTAADLALLRLDGAEPLGPGRR